MHLVHFRILGKARGVLQHPARLHPSMQEGLAAHCPRSAPAPITAHCLHGVTLCAGTALGQALLSWKPWRFNCLSFFPASTKCLNAPSNMQYSERCVTVKYQNAKGEKKKRHLKIDCKILKLFIVATEAGRKDHYTHGSSIPTYLCNTREPKQTY